MSIIDDIINGVSNLLGLNKQEQSSSTGNTATTQSSADNSSAPGRDLSSIEKALLDVKDTGQNIATGFNRGLGLNTDDEGNFDILGTWGDIVDFDEDDDGQTDLGRVATTPLRLANAAAQTVGALPGMMVQGFSEMPTYLYSAGTGSPIAQEGAVEDGKIVADDLDVGERVGSGVYGALNIVPVGFGSIAKVGSVAAKQTGKQIAKEAAEQAGKDLTERAVKNEIKQAGKESANKWVATHTIGGKGDTLIEDFARGAEGTNIGTAAKGIGLKTVSQFMEEGSEEAIQEMGQNTLNDQNILDNTFESFVGGGLAGGTMGALRGVAKTAKDSMTTKKEPIVGPEEVNTDTNPTEANSTGRSTLTPDASTPPALSSPYYNTSSSGNVLSAVKEELNKDMQSINVDDDATQAMGYGLFNVENVDNAEVGWRDIENLLDAEYLTYADSSQRPKKATTYFQEFANTYRGKYGNGDILQQFRRINNAATENQFYDDLNAWLDVQQKNGNYLPLYIKKQPGGVISVIKTNLSKVRSDSAVGLSQATAFCSNADFDSDKYTISVDNANQYGAVKYTSEMLSSPDTLSDIKDLAATLGIRKDNIDEAVDAFKQYYTNSGINSSDLNIADFESLIRYVLEDKVGIENHSRQLTPKAEQLYKTGLDSFYPIVGWIRQNSTVDNAQQIALLEKFLQDSNAFKTSQSNVRYKASRVARTLSELWTKADPKDGKRTSTKGKVGSNKTVVEAFIERFRKRIYIDTMEGGIACREGLSAYQLIKQQIYMYANNNPGKSLHEIDLVEAMLRSDIGCMMFASHPEELTSSAIRDMTASNAKIKLNRKIRNAADWTELESITADYYKQARSKFLDLVKEYNQDAYEMLTSDNAIVPSWPKDEDTFAQNQKDKIMLSLYGQEDISFLGISTRNKMTYSIEGALELFCNNRQDFNREFEGPDFDFAYSLMNRFTNTLKDTQRITEQQFEKAIANTLDSGVKEALDELAKHEYNIDELNIQDQSTITYWCETLGYMAARKDCRTAGFIRDIDIVNAAKDGQGVYKQIAQYLLSSDAANVKQGLITLTFNTKLHSLYEKTSSTESTEEIINELRKLQEISPLYNAIASYFYHQTFNEETQTFDMAEINRIKNGWLGQLLTDFNSDTINRTIGFIINSSEVSPILDSEHWFANALETKTDKLDLTSPMARLRKAKVHYQRASNQNRLACERRTARFFDDSGILKADQKEQAAVLSAIELYAVKNRYKANVDGFVHVANVATHMVKDVYNKTSAISGAASIWDSNSIADLGFVPTETENLASWVIKTKELTSNPQLASLLFLTDYIEEQGGIRLSLSESGTTSSMIKDRYELMSLILEKNITEADFKSGRGVVTLRELCDWCPNMINIIQPVAKSYQDTGNSTSVQYGQGAGQTILDIMQQVNKLHDPLHNASDTTYGIWTDEQIREEIKNEMVAQNILSSRDLLTFTLATLDYEKLPDYDNGQKRSQIIRKHLYEKVVPWIRNYMASTEVEQQRLLNQLTSSTASENITQYQKSLRTMEYVREASLLGTIDSNDIVQEQMLEKMISNVKEALSASTTNLDDAIKKLNITSPSFQKVAKKKGFLNWKTYEQNNNKNIHELIMERFDFLKEEITRPPSDLCLLMCERWGVDAHRYNSPIKIENENTLIPIYEKYTSQIKSLKQLIEDDINRINNWLNNLSNKKASACKPEVDNVIRILNTQLNLIDTITDAAGFALGISKQNQWRIMKRSVISSSHNNALKKFFDLFDPAVLELHPDIDESISVNTFLDNMNEALKRYTSSPIAESSNGGRVFVRFEKSFKELDEITKKFMKEKPSLTPNEQSQYRRQIRTTMTRIAGKVLTNIATMNNLTERTTSDFTLKFADEAFGITSNAINHIENSGLKNKINQISNTPVHEKQYVPDLKFHLTNEWGDYQIGNIATNIVTGNVVSGVTKEANTRKAYTALALVPDDLNFSPLSDERLVSNGLIKDNITAADLVAEFRTKGGFDSKEVKQEYYGHYREKSPSGAVGDWKPISPTTIAIWSMQIDEGRFTDKDIQFRSVMGDSVGFEPAAYMPSSDGRPFNQFCSILAKFPLNGAEPLNLTTAKDPTIYAAASFVNEVKEHKQNVINKGIIKVKPQDDVRDVAIKCIRNTKEAYNEMLNVAISGKRQKALDLSAMDMNVLTNHVVQGVVIHFKEGPIQVLTYKDLLETDVLTYDSQTQVTYVEPFIFELTELGEMLNKEAIKDYKRNVQQTDTSFEHYDDMNQWHESVKHAIQNLNLNVATDEQIRQELSDAFSRSVTQPIVGRSNFTLPNNAKVEYFARDNESFNESPILNDPAYKESVDELKNYFGIKVAQYYGSPDSFLYNPDEFRRLASYTKSSDIKNSSNWAAHQIVVFDDGNLDLGHIFNESKNKNANIVFITSSDSKMGALKSQAVSQGFRVTDEKAQVDPTVFESTQHFIFSVSHNRALDEYQSNRPTADLQRLDPNAIDIVELSDNTPTVDGSMALTSEGITKMNNTKAEITRKHTVSISDLDTKNTPSYAALVPPQELGNVFLSKESVIDALVAQRKLTRVDAIKQADQVLETFRKLKRQSSKNFTQDGIFIGKCKHAGNNVIGVCKKIINDVEYYEPIIVNLHQDSKVDVITSTADCGGLIELQETTPLMGKRGTENGNRGVIKVFMSDLSIKTTLDTSAVLPSRYVHSARNSKIGVEKVTAKEWQGGKIDPYIYIPTNYIRDIKLMGLSPWFTYEQGTGYKVNQSWFNDAWTPEDITQFYIGSFQERQRIADRIADPNDPLMFVAPKGISPRVPLTLRLICQNAIEYKFDPFTAISGLEISEQGKKAFQSDTEVININNIVFPDDKANVINCDAEYPASFVFDGIDFTITSDIQDLFHAIDPKRYRAYDANDTTPTSQMTEEFNQWGERRIENPDGSTYYAWVIYTKPNYDQTQSPLQDPPFGASTSNKQKMLNAMSYRDTLNGNLASLMLEMLIDNGESNIASPELKRLKKERQAVLGPQEQRDAKKRSRDFFQSTALKQQDPIVAIEKTIRERTFNNYFYAWDKAVVPLVEFKDGKPERISLAQKEASQVAFVDERLNTLKSYMEERIMGGNQITCKDFLTVLKYATSYAEEKNAAEPIVFDIKSMKELIDNIEHNISEPSCFPFGVDATYRNNKGTFVRYGMPIMKMDVFNIFRNNNPEMKEHYAGKSDTEIYNQMIDTFDQMINSNREKLQKSKRRSLYAIAEYEAIGTPMENNDVFAVTISGLTPQELADYMDNLDASLLGGAYEHLPEIKQIAEENKAKMVKTLERQSKSKKHLYKDSLHGRSVQSIIRNKGEAEAVGAINLMCSLRRTMSIAGRFMLIPSAIAEKFRYSTPMKMTLRQSLKGSGPLGSVYKSNVSKYLNPEQVDLLIDAVAETSRTKPVTNLYGLIKSVAATGDFDWVLNEAANDYNGMASYLKAKIESGGIFSKAENIFYSWSSGLNVGNYQQVEVFINDLIRLVSLDDNLAATYLGGAEPILVKNFQADPESFIASCFKADSPLRSVAIRAFNTSLQGDAAQRTVMSTLIHEYCSAYPVLDLFMGTYLCPFLQYGINATGRALNAVLPISTFHQLIINKLSKSNKKVPGLGETRWSDFNWDDQQTVESIAEALKIDMLNMGTTAVACLLVGLGCMEPPDDDDKWGNVDEWTFMGQRIQVNWWLKDIIGPSLGIACAMKSAALGKPNLAVLFNDLATCMWSNPLVRSSELVELIVNPYGVYQEQYYNDLERYSGMEDSNPSGSEVLFSNLGISSINWLMGFCTPGILKDLYKEGQIYEVSSKRIYEVDQTGQRTEDSYTDGATQKTTYFDAKLREQTKKNPVLAWLCDTFVPHTTGYFADEMPRTVYYDPAQMESYQALSLYTTDENGNQVLKSEKECQAIALGVIIQLQSYESMEDLYKTGFCMPYETMDYVSDMVWDIIKQNTDIYDNMVSSGALDAYKLGDGDNETGTQLAAEIRMAYDNSYSYWTDFYYNKLWSDEMKQGLQTYNRYATSYEQDANGDWYATGYRRNLGNIVSPFLVASGAHSDALGIDDPGSTMGYDNDWATQSVVTGESTGQRALIPVKKDIETPKLEDRATTSNGYSKSYSGGYSRSYGGSGYSRSYGFSYTAPKNSLNFNTPYANTIDPGKVYTTPYKSASFDKLYPSFETQGSRKAYKREDI